VILLVKNLTVRKVILLVIGLLVDIQLQHQSVYSLKELFRSLESALADFFSKCLDIQASIDLALLYLLEIHQLLLELSQFVLSFLGHELLKFPALFFSDLVLSSYLLRTRLRFRYEGSLNYMVVCIHFFFGFFVILACSIPVYLGLGFVDSLPFALDWVNKSKTFVLFELFDSRSAHENVVSLSFFFPVVFAFFVI
jgi:hypothetical protein